MVDTTTRDPRAYELMAIFLPDLSDEETGEQIERVSGYLTAQNATIINVNTDSPWGRRRIAYTIRFNSVDYRDGIYVVINFEAVPSAIGEIERDLKLDTRVMRYLLVLNDPAIAEDEDVEGEGDEPATAEAAPAATAIEDAAETTESAAPTEEPAAVTEDTADTTAEDSAATTEEAEVATEETSAAAEEADVATKEANVSADEADAASTDETEDSKKED